MFGVGTPQIEMGDRGIPAEPRRERGSAPQMEALRRFVNLGCEVFRLHLRKDYKERGTLKSCIFTGLLEEWKSGKGHLRVDSKFGGVWLKKIPVWGAP